MYHIFLHLYIKICHLVGINLKCTLAMASSANIQMLKGIRKNYVVLACARPTGI